MNENSNMKDEGNVVLDNETFEKLKKFCEHNNYGMAVLGNRSFCVVLVGRSGHSLVQVSLAAAQLMISSALEDITAAALSETNAEDETEIPKEKVN